MKRCTTCNTVKANVEFNKDSRGVRGLRFDCKVCRAVKTKVYREDYSQQIRVRKRREYDENRDAICDYQKEYRVLNRATISVQRRDFREQNRDRINQDRRDIYMEDPSNALHTVSMRRCAQMNRTPPWFEKDAVAFVYKVAAHRRSLGEDVHVDHIIPLQGELVSGLHCRDNLQILDSVENMSKGNRFEIS